MLRAGDDDSWAAPWTAAAIPPSTTAPEYGCEPAAEQAPNPRAPMASSANERRMTKLNLTRIDSVLVDAACRWSGADAVVARRAPLSSSSALSASSLASWTRPFAFRPVASTPRAKRRTGPAIRPTLVLQDLVKVPSDLAGAGSVSVVRLAPVVPADAFVGPAVEVADCVVAMRQVVVVPLILQPARGVDPLLVGNGLQRQQATAIGSSVQPPCRTVEEVP